MSFFWQAVIVEGGLAIVALIVGLCFGLPYWENAALDGETCYLIALTTLPLILGYFALKALPWAGVQRVDQLVRELYQQYMKQLPLWQLAVIALLAGVGEELFFRGMIQMGLAHFVNIWIAVLVTSLLFGLAHAVTPTYFYVTFVVSLYFGWLFVHTENLVIPIAVHAVYDLFVFIYIRYTQPDT